MRVSVIIPAYNSERFLSQTIESVQRQTFSDWELIVVDDGSSDGTASIAQSYACRDIRVRVVQQANSGLAAARNRGYTESNPTSQFVAFLDNDDVWDPDALETLVQLLEGNPAAVGAHGNHRYIDAAGRPCDADGRPWHADQPKPSVLQRWALLSDGIVPWPDDKPTTFAVLVLVYYPVTPGLILIRRSALNGMEVEGMELFDRNCDPAPDWDLWLRLSRQGDFAYLDKVILGYRRHESNLTHQGTRVMKAHTSTLLKVAGSPEYSEEQRHCALMVIGFVCTRWARELRSPDMKRREWPDVSRQSVLLDVRRTLAGLCSTASLTERQRAAAESAIKVIDSLDGPKD
jgi:glycosyltransferase involved in cell wall biosynthesis